MKINVSKDEDGYLAEVDGIDYLFAYGETEEEAKQELYYVVEMTIEVHEEELKKEKKVKKTLFRSPELCAV